MRFFKDTVTLELTKLTSSNYKINTSNTLEDNWIRVVEEVELQVEKNQREYKVVCYHTGIIDDENNSDSYVIRVYCLGKEIGMTDVDSNGNSYDEGLRLDDEELELAIMDTLFNQVQPIIEPF